MTRLQPRHDLRIPGRWAFRALARVFSGRYPDNAPGGIDKGQQRISEIVSPSAIQTARLAVTFWLWPYRSYGEPFSFTSRPSDAR